MFDNDEGFDDYDYDDDDDEVGLYTNEKKNRKNNVYKVKPKKKLNLRKYFKYAALALGVLFLLWILSKIISFIGSIEFSRKKKHDEGNGYKISCEQDNKWNYQALLEKNIFADNETNLEYKNLFLRVSMMNDDTFRIKINPTKETETECKNLSLKDDNFEENMNKFENIWEVPDNFFGKTDDFFDTTLKWNGFEHDKDQGLIKTPVFSTYDTDLVVSKYYIKQSFMVESTNIFGFGERTREFELTPGNYTSWADGGNITYDPGEKGGNSYGDHPFVLIRLNNGKFAGIFFKNSNAKVLEYTQTNKINSVLTFKAIGGILDFFMFHGETADEVLSLYHQVIGSPYLPPFWAFGFHQSSWGYNEGKVLDQVIKGYDESKIPLESIWLDIEYMDGYKNFLVDKTKFKDLNSKSKSLHKNNQKLITVINAGLTVDETYK